MIKFYTIGEIFRAKLLLNHHGKPYTSKAAISRIVSLIGHTEGRSPFGKSKLISDVQIKEWNNHWK